MTNKQKTLAFVLGLALLLGIGGITYAYFATGTNNGNSREVKVATGSTYLVLEDVDPITQEDKISPNNLTVVRYLTIRNEGTIEAYAKLLWKDLYNNFVTNDLIYSLEEIDSNKQSLSTPNVIITNEVIPKSSTATNIELANSLLIPAGTSNNGTVTPSSKYYKLIVHYNYSTTENQDDDLNKVFTSGFTMEEGIPPVKVSTTNGVEMTMSNTNINTTLSPSRSVTKTFTLTNTTNEVQKVNVELVNVTNTSSDVTVDLTKGNTTIVDDQALPVVTNETVVIKKELEIPAAEDASYTITINNNGNSSTQISGTVNTQKSSSAIVCVDESGNEMTECPSALAIGQRFKIGDQYFRYIRTTNTEDTAHSYNECNDGGSSSIACSDGDTRHPLENNQLRLLAEYNLYVGAIYNSSESKISDVDTTSATYGLQDSTARGYVDNQNRVGTVAYGPNTYYSQSNVKSYTDTYANYLNTTYFGGENEVSGSAITLEELKMLGCNRSSNACSRAPIWVYTSSYWSGSPYNSIYIWDVRSDAYFNNHDYNYDGTYGVRPVIMLNKDILQ